MSERSTRVSETELTILEVLWRVGGCTASAIGSEVYAGSSRSKAATVHSLLERLENKGLVARDRQVYPHQFSALATRDDYVAGELERMAGQVFEGSLTPLLMNLAGRAQLTQEERARILALLERSEGDDEAAGDEE